jgi:hypothetical protein
MINFKKIVKKVSDFLLENKQFDKACEVLETTLVNEVTGLILINATLLLTVKYIAAASGFIA